VHVLVGVKVGVDVRVTVWLDVIVNVGVYVLVRVEVGVTVGVHPSIQLYTVFDVSPEVSRSVSEAVLLIPVQAELTLTLKVRLPEEPGAR
jgi:hypothetical protein